LAEPKLPGRPDDARRAGGFGDPLVNVMLEAGRHE
jgi:hypothetical protein